MWDIQELDEEKDITPKKNVAAARKTSTMPLNLMLEYNGDVIKTPLKYKSSGIMQSQFNQKKSPFKKEKSLTFFPKECPTPGKKPTHNDSGTATTNVKPTIWATYGKIIVCFLLKPIHFVYNLIRSTYNPKDQKDFAFKYRILVRGLKKDLKLCKFYFFFDLLRYFFVTLVAIFLIGYSIAQVFLMETVCFFFFCIYLKMALIKIKLTESYHILKKFSFQWLLYLE